MNNRQPGGLAQIAQQGRYGDTQLAHVNPQEMALLKSLGGSGTINPDTGLPEFFSLKKLGRSIGKTVGKIVSTPIRLTTNAATNAVRLPFRAFDGIAGTKTDKFGRALSRPLRGIGNTVESGLESLAQLPVSVSSGTVNLIKDPVDQFEQIGRETGRVAMSPYLPMAVSLIPGVGPVVGAGISAAQAGYASRKGGLDDILKNAALAGGTSYLTSRALQGALGKIGISGNPYAPKPELSGFDFGNGSGSLANSLGLNLAGASQAAAPTFNLGTGAGSLAGSLGLNLAGLGGAASTGFNLASGAGSIANTIGLGSNLSPTPEQGGFGLRDLQRVGQFAGRVAGAAPSTPESSGSGVGGLLGAGLGAAGVYGLLGLLDGGKPTTKPLVAPAMSAADQANYNRPSTQFDWGAISKNAQEMGVSPSEYVARNFEKAAGQVPSPEFAKPIGMKRGGALSDVMHLVKGQGTGREDLIDARLSDGEYIMDAETVALLGDGSTDAGAKRLDAMRENLRAHKGKMLSRGKISPNAKSPLAYLKGVK